MKLNTLLEVLDTFQICQTKFSIESLEISGLYEGTLGGTRFKCRALRSGN